MQVRELAHGLSYWTAPHPAWKPEFDRPGGWGQMVGCVYAEPPADRPGALILIDPLAPPEGTPNADRFWRALDEDVERLGLPLAVLIANVWHGRSADAIRTRYGSMRAVEVWAHEAARGKASCQVTRTFVPPATLPSGVEVRAVDGVEESEVAFWLPWHGALCFADAVIGAGGGALRVEPESWSPDDRRPLYATTFRPSLRALLDLAVERVLCGHGEPVNGGGHAALAAALEAPAWGAG
jgi:hypothetical protein